MELLIFNTRFDIQSIDEYLAIIDLGIPKKMTFEKGIGDFEMAYMETDNNLGVKTLEVDFADILMFYGPDYASLTAKPCICSHR